MADPSPPPSHPFAAVVLAAGKGTRMKSDLHKVLHPIAGRSMLGHLLASVESLGPERTVVVVGSLREQVEAALAGRALVALQDPQLGTAHAVQQAQTALAGFSGDVLILYGDVPFVTPATLDRMLARLHAPDAPAVVVLASRPADPLRYGRVIADGDRIVKMIEWKDATEDERAVTLCNSGMMAVRAVDLWPLLARVGNDNAAREYYLPDIVMLAAASEGRASAVIEADPWETEGINSRAELAQVEGEWQRRRRAQAMDAGVTLIAPETVWFAHDTAIGRDVTIEPNVFFGPGVTIAEGAVIHGFSHIEGATIAARAEVGPYARLRPGAVLEANTKVGNFVEIKKAVIAEGAKVNHLSYIGDADIGAKANIGAGTITCNYDGFFKYRTKIGAGAFIGSNSALVAPVTIGDGAIVAAGSVVTRDVGADALALVRPPQDEKPGWAKRFRERMAVRKKAGSAAAGE